MIGDLERDVPDLDAALDALGHVHRRRILLTLLERDPVEDPRTAVAVDGNPVDPEQFVTTYHVHLPKLEEYGFVEWDRDTDVLRRGPQFEVIEPLLVLLDDHEDDLPDGWT